METILQNATMNHLLWIVCLCCLVGSCTSELPDPKPRGYPKVEYPDRTYQQFDTGFCAFAFEYPAYATVEQDTAFFEEVPANPCWFDLYFQDFEGRIHFSYYPIDSEANWETLRDDAFEMADVHQKRANSIDEIRISKPGGVGGLAFDIKGPAASPYQFFLTDSSKHFLRAALYFNTQARPDSLAPIVEFVKEDISHLIETFEWSER